MAAGTRTQTKDILNTNNAAESGQTSESKEAKEKK